MKDIVFDYFNIITKEYEMAYEKWRGDKAYQEAIGEIKASVDKDYVDRKFEELPKELTKEKA